MNTREIKARIIVAGGGVAWAGTCYHVRSQSGSGLYRVTLNGLFPTCTCEDHELTWDACKHIIAARLWAEQQRADPQPTPQVPTTPPEKPKRKTYAQDWPNYNLAQNREKDHFQDLLADLCRSIPDAPPKGGKKGGRPTVPARDATFLAVFKVYCGMSARRFVCDMQAAHERRCITDPVCHNSVLKALESADLTPILHDLIRRSAAPLAAVEEDFAVDSSGFCTNSYTRWYDVKYGERQQQHWVKAHIATGVRTNVVTAVAIHGKHANDCNVLPELVQTTAQTFDIREVSGDKAYAAGANFEAVAALGATLYAPFKKNATGYVGGLYEKMYHLFCLNREDYLAHYHKRSNVESTFSAVKRKWGEMVRSKTDAAQRNETLCKFVCQNVCCLISAMYELGVLVDATPGDETRVLKFPGVA